MTVPTPVDIDLIMPAVPYGYDTSVFKTVDSPDENCVKDISIGLAGLSAIT